MDLGGFELEDRETFGGERWEVFSSDVQANENLAVPQNQAEEMGIYSDHRGLQSPMLFSRAAVAQEGALIPLQSLQEQLAGREYV